MKEKYYFDFFDDATILKQLSRYFKLDCDEIIDYLCVKEEYDLLEFIKRFKINLYDFDSSKLEIKCKHITTANDKLQSFKEKGLLNLRDMLTLNTPLSAFLHKENIKINIEEKTFIYKDKKCPIISHNEECEKCFYDNCKYIKTILGDTATLYYKDECCDYRQAITCLSNKLYHDKCEIEVFIYGDIDEIKEYSTIIRNPEILLTIDEIINNIFGEELDLQNKWRERNNSKAYILEFYFSIKNFEYINTKEYFDGFYDVKEYFGIDIDNEENDINFYSNLFILVNSLNCYYGSAKRYGQLFSEVNIPFSMLKVCEI
jgi:hypothetical protein